MPKTNYKLNREQREHLDSRIDAARYGYDELPTPKNVIAAQKLVASFEEKKNDHDRKSREAWAKRKRQAREVLVFGTPEDALKAVKALEADAAKARRDSRW